MAITSGGAVPAGAANPRPVVHAASARTTGLAAGNPFCKGLGKRYWASAGAHMFCFGRQPNGPATGQTPADRSAGTSSNVDAASFAEDVSPAGVRLYGQSETSIAASGPYVAEEWNDSTTFASPCPSPMAKEEGSGFGFSANGGKSFTDLGGLPNAQCNKDLLEGDPSVAAYRVGGSTYFYFSSLFNSPTGLGLSKIGMNACKVVGSGPGATLSCGQPITVGNSTQCRKVKISATRTAKFCCFLDKEFIAIDPARGRLYVSYTDFLISPPTYAVGLDRNELGALLVAAGLGQPAEHALIALLALNGLRVSEATGANIGALGLERGHRTLMIARTGGKVVTLPLAPRAARAIDLAVGERTDGPLFLTAGGGRLDRHGAARIVRRAAHRAGLPSRSGRPLCGTRSSPRHWTLGCRCGTCRKPLRTLTLAPP